MEDNKTKEEILKASYYWHAASDGVYYREDAVYEAMESYSQQSNRQKEDRIAALERELFNAWNNDFDLYPLPICFDPGQEQRELYGRDNKIKRDIKELGK